MIYFPLQAFGIGDIIFCNTLVRKLAAGDKILWGCEGHFADGLNRAYGDITFIDKSMMNIDYNRRDDYILNGVRVLPLRWSDVNAGVPYDRCMSQKYLNYGVDYNTWTDQAMWNRDKEKEVELMRVLGIEEGMDFTLVNRFFGSNSQLVAPIKEKGIEMCTVEGFSLFDWSGIIERASAIHVVSSSIIYLTELLNLKAPAVHLYRRAPIESDFRNVEYLLKRQNYILHL